MTEGEALCLFVGLIIGISTSFLLIFAGDYSTYRDLQKRLKKERRIMK